jgi:hypothetical protein
MRLQQALGLASKVLLVPQQGLLLVILLLLVVYQTKHC